MPEILTKNLPRGYEQPPAEAQEKMKEIITEIERVGFDERLASKSVLISDNIKGIVQIRVDNAYLYNRFGIRIGIRDELCESKLRVVRSRDGKGIIALESLLKALKSEMNMMPAPPTGMLDAALTPVRQNK